MKKIFAVLAIIASLFYIFEIYLNVSQGNIGLPLLVKSLLVVAFVYYAVGVFKNKPKINKQD